MTALPTRRDEAWRYADLARLAPLWPARDPVRRRLEGADLSLDERIDGDGWHDAEIDVAVSEGGRLIGTIEQVAGADATVTVLYRITLAAHARATLTLLSHGAAYGRLALDISLAEGAVLDLGGAIVGGGSQTLEIITTVRHIGPGATSRQTIRAVAAGRAVASYLGQVAVSREGQQTDAAQSFKALLLDRGATANAKPELEIFADDVKCAHGASVGELDAQALFYMASRGIAPADAEALLARAFVDDALAALPEGPAREALGAQLQALVARRGEG
ncbi:SufD family Fe-S cluster assembly protein [Polymorphobacter sp.]|uniref:SufD family Fe-S cluster assembly protein n=1 Tax=Polymorphobacter sp. TaxID=1909290 RepID=UPI003F70D800